MAPANQFKQDEPFIFKIERAVRQLQKMSAEEGIQLLVQSGEITQEEADEAIARYRARTEAEASDSGGPVKTASPAGPSPRATRRRGR